VIRNLISFHLFVFFFISCIEPTRDISQQEQVAVSMVLNANPMDSLPDILKNLADDYYKTWTQGLGVDLSYIINRIIDKNDSIYVIGDSLNTMIPANIIVFGDQQEYAFNSGHIQKDSIIVEPYPGHFTFYYSQFLPFLRDEEWQIQAGSKYTVSIQTKDGIIYTGHTQVPGEFHFLPWEDGKYLKKVDNDHWKMRWSESSNGYEYSFQLWGFNDDYNYGRFAEIVEVTNESEIERMFHFVDEQYSGETPGIDAPYPNKFFAWVYVYDENLYRYKYLLQDPAGWSNCLGVLGSTNLATIVFEQDLE